MSQTSVDTRIRKPSALFRLSKPTGGIHVHSGSHFKRYRKPEYRRNANAAWQALRIQDGIVDASLFRTSQITSAAANSAGQEDIQLSSALI
jgi:hypothetical protein